MDRNYPSHPHPHYYSHQPPPPPPPYQHPPSFPYPHHNQFNPHYFHPPFCHQDHHPNAAPPIQHFNAPPPPPPPPPHAAAPNVVGGDGVFRSYNDRKRGRPASPDHNEGVGYTKLYVATVPRTVTTEDIWPLFQEYGNVIEVVFPMDKKHRLRGEYCFVKYSTREEADRAIKALNGQYTIPGEPLPIVVRYADMKRDNFGKVDVEQPGGSGGRLYVGGLNKQASKQEIRELFSVYGNVEDIYIGLDELKQGRGFAFVKFSHLDMALAAIRTLHGTFTMRGCDQPLIVRFADPIKPRPGESRPLSSFGDSVGACAIPTSSCPVQQSSLNSLTMTSSCTTKQASQHPQPQMPSRADSESQKQTQHLGQQQSTQDPVEEAVEIVNNAQVACSASASPLVSPCTQTPNSEVCDWSEHTCPDGYKYYYNCVTCESKWEMPEEFTLCQQRLPKREKFPNPGHQCVSNLPTVTSEVDTKPKDVERAAHIL